MNQTVFYGSLVLLVASIIFLIRQIRVLRAKRQGLGEVVFEIFPSRMRRLVILVVGIAFVVMMIIMTILNVIKGGDFNFTYPLVIALTCFAAGSFLSRVTILYQNGILAYLKVIEYHAIKHYEFKDMRKRKSMYLYLQFDNDLGFQTVIKSADRQALDKILRKFV